MPKCYGCERPAPGGELRPFGENNRGWPEDELGCSHCRRIRLTQVVGRLPKREAEEKPMSKEKKPILSIRVFEGSKNDQGETNFAIEVSAQIGGLTMSFERTTDEIRDYFTAKRQRSMDKKLVKGGRKLQAVQKTDEE